MQNTKGSLAQQLAEAKANEEKEKALNGMIDNIVSLLVNGSTRHAAEALRDLAVHYSKGISGYVEGDDCITAPQAHTLFNIARADVIKRAVAISDQYFIAEKLKEVERELQNARRKIIQ